MSWNQPPGYPPPQQGYGPPPGQQPYGYGPPPQIIVQAPQNRGMNTLAWVLVVCIGLPFVLGLGSCIACAACSVGVASAPTPHRGR